MSIVVYALSALLILAMGGTVLLGRKVRHIRQSNGMSDALVNLHKWSARACFIITSTIVLLVEGMMTARYGWHARPYLPGFSEHLWGFAVPFFVLLATCVFFVTGKLFPKWHKFFVYVCAGWSIPMVITGDILISHMH